ncbi:MAG: PKD domain-containing protein [Nitrospirota bacterium]
MRSGEFAKQCGIRYLVVLVMMIACMFLSSNVTAHPLENPEKVPQSAVDSLAFGSSQDLIVLFNEAPVLKQSAFLKEAYGVSEDIPEILAFKASNFDQIKQGVLSSLPPGDVEVLMDYSHLPMMFLKFRSLQSLNQLLSNPDVIRAYENQPYRHFLSQSLPLINQPQVAASGRVGTGTAVAILDTGVDYTRTAFGSCTSPGVPSTCKVVYAQDFAPNDGQRDVFPYHGTNVAGISLGVAPDTRIIALDVFSGNSAWSNHIINAINWCIANKATYNIVAINMSLGGGGSTTPCGSDVFAAPVASARSAGILSSIASGNNAYTNQIASPGCVPAAVSVGAVYDANVGPQFWSNCTDFTTAADKVTCFSNSASFLTMLAPGCSISAAGISMCGTSQAAPHIAGAIAVLKGAGAYPSETPDQIVNRMTSSGVPITDWRNAIIKPRIDLLAAAGTETPPVANFTGSPTSGTAPLTVNFTDTSTGSPTSWAWTFGDGGSSTLRNPSHTYNNPGTYTVSLTATNAYGSDPETKTGYITVLACAQPPYISFLNPSSGNVDQSIMIYGRSFASPYLVFFNGVQATVTYTSPWQLVAKVPAGATSGPVWVEGPAGCISNEKPFTVIGTLPAPVANFTASPTSGTAPLTVNFTDTSTGSPTSWAWAFGDGGSSTLQNPSHTYNNPGTYTVSLTATNANGSDTETKIGYITVSSPAAPVANFTGSPTTGTAPLTVNFTDTSTGSPTSWAWAFGDGGSSTLRNPSHTYNNPGTYTVSLTATNANGSNTLTRTNYITVQAPQTCPNPPLITLLNPTSGKVNQTITIYGRSFASPYLVFFNGVQATVTYTSPWQLVAKVPAGATSGPVWVEGPIGCRSNEKPFTVTP